MTVFTFDIEQVQVQGENEGSYRHVRLIGRVTRAQLRSISVEAETISDAWKNARNIIDQHEGVAS